MIHITLDPETQDPDGRENRTVPVADTFLVQIPKAFYSDHVARDLIAGNVERETKRAFFVRMDRVVAEELINDAESIIDYWRSGAYEPEMIGLASSATATRKRVKEALAALTS